MARVAVDFHGHVTSHVLRLPRQLPRCWQRKQWRQLRRLPPTPHIAQWKRRSAGQARPLAQRLAPVLGPLLAWPVQCSKQVVCHQKGCTGRRLEQGASKEHAWSTMDTFNPAS